MCTAQDRPPSAERPADFAWKPMPGCPAHTASSVPSGAADTMAEKAPTGPHRTCRLDQVFPASAVNQIGARSPMGPDST